MCASQNAQFVACVITVQSSMQSFLPINSLTFCTLVGIQTNLMMNTINLLITDNDRRTADMIWSLHTSKLDYISHTVT